MTLKAVRPTSPGRRHQIKLVKEVANVRPEKSLVVTIKKSPGRLKGRVTVRHKEVGEKKYYRLVDFVRSKKEVPARVLQLEYDPYRSANIALIVYADGEKSYILAPIGLKVGSQIMSSASAEPTTGNCLPLVNIPLGVPIHNVEIYPGRGGQLVRSAGVAAYILAKEGGYAQVKLPSGEIHKILDQCRATVGLVGNEDWKNIRWGKAGRSRHRGIRPSVRGVAMHPNAHPHGGGEGRSGIGMPGPKTPWGKPAMGKKTRQRFHTDKYIISRRTR